MLEFTGERVVPGLVDPNLLNEHLARYRFAARYAKGAAVLDAGCGTGYGSHEMRAAASVTAMDIAHDALRHAAGEYGREGLRFARGSLEALPFADGAFDLVTAFEVIEHLEHWDEMLREARRVLKAGGVLLVSTPNKSYYAESRGESGPNPYHTHEFEYEEFRAALQAVFPHVQLWTQNRTEALVFVPVEASAGTLDAAGDRKPEEAHFYLAACSGEPIADTSAFGWLPEAGNLLRERERHIELLFGEIERRKKFEQELEQSRAAMIAAEAVVTAELAKSNAWANKLTLELQTAGRRIDELQEEVAELHAGYRERIDTLENEAGERLDWAARLEEQIETGDREIERLRGEESRLNNVVRERTVWAERLNEELAQTQAQMRARVNDLRTILRMTAESRWVRTGRKLGLGPDLKAEDFQAE